MPVPGGPPSGALWDLSPRRLKEDEDAVGTEGDTAVAAVLLSAGASSRFGGEPKALLPVGERTSVRRMAEIALADGFDPVAVVVGAHHGPIAHELRGVPVSVVNAERWYEGRTASVQAGLSAVPADRDVLFWPVDHPFVSPRTIDLLLAARARDALAVWFVPTYQGTGGHPVIWRRPVREEILRLRPDAPIRSLLPEFGPQVRRIPVADPGVTANIDTPEAYRAAHDLWSSNPEE
jgi:molybdenum cofactor cytidylyltransferase